MGAPLSHRDGYREARSNKLTWALRRLREGTGQDGVILLSLGEGRVGVAVSASSDQLVRVLQRVADRILEDFDDGRFDEAQPDGFYPAPPHGWTCFHCGETFTTEDDARDHFGFDCSCDPACRIKAGEERGLVKALRNAEQEIVRLVGTLHCESAEAFRQLRRVQSQIGDHARDAEQAGYDRALRDVEAGRVEPDHARRIIEALSPIAAPARKDAAP